MRRGFTLIELLIVVAILAILAALILPSVMTHPKEFTAQVTEKWTDINGDMNQVFLVRTRDENQEVNTWISQKVHDRIAVNAWYRFTARGSWLYDAKLVSSGER